jgi:hypothetical protein
MWQTFVCSIEATTARPGSKIAVTASEVMFFADPRNSSCPVRVKAALFV